MRSVWVICNNKVQGEWDLDEMYECFKEITANGHTAYDIKFDFEGNILVFITDCLTYKNEEK